MKNVLTGFALFWFITLSASGQGRVPPQQSTHRNLVPSIFSQLGMASWYGAESAGTTASGEPFNMNQFTAAHRELPFNTQVIVTNLKNGRSVNVRINDRGPHIAGRLIDVSKAAAVRLGFRHSGEIPVQVTVVHLPKGYAPEPQVQPSIASNFGPSPYQPNSSAR